MTVSQNHIFFLRFVLFFSLCNVKFPRTLISSFKLLKSEVKTKNKHGGGVVYVYI